MRTSHNSDIGHLAGKGEDNFSANGNRRTPPKLVAQVKMKETFERLQNPGLCKKSQSSEEEDNQSNQLGVEMSPEQKHDMHGFCKKLLRRVQLSHT